MPDPMAQASVETTQNSTSTPAMLSDVAAIDVKYAAAFAELEARLAAFNLLAPWSI